jgi:hypothetical protein
MIRKKLFYFTLALNGFFYFMIAVFFYVVQNQNNQDLTTAYYDKLALQIDQEMTGRQEFYQQWFAHLPDLPKDKHSRALYFKNRDIEYLGKFVGETLEPIPPFTKPPPFPRDVLKSNSRYLFFRNDEHLFFTYTMTDQKQVPHIVVQQEDRSYFLRRAGLTGSKIIVIENENGQKSQALFSNLKPEQTKSLEENFKFGDTMPRLYKLSNESFYVVSIPLYSSTKFKQTLALAFNMNAFFFTATFSMAVFLLACFCASIGLLYFGYLKSRP